MCFQRHVSDLLCRLAGRLRAAWPPAAAVTVVVFCCLLHRLHIPAAPCHHSYIYICHILCHLRVFVHTKESARRSVGPSRLFPVLPLRLRLRLRLRCDAAAVLDTRARACLSVRACRCQVMVTQSRLRLIASRRLLLTMRELARRWHGTRVSDAILYN